MEVQTQADALPEVSDESGNVSDLLDSNEIDIENLDLPITIRKASRQLRPPALFASTAHPNDKFRHI